MREKRSGTVFGVAGWRPKVAGRRLRRGAGTRRMGGAGVTLHLLGAIAMLLGLLLPLTDAGRALAAPTADPATTARAQEQETVATTSFTQVTAVGTFQNQLGCADFDPFCGGSALANHNGLWTATFPVAPGEYQWQIVALTQDGQQHVFGERGLNGGPENVDVDDDEAGIYFSFNAATQELNAEAVDAAYTLVSDLGSFALGPDGGDLTVVVPSPGGGLNLELQVNGAAVGNPQFVELEPGPSRITLDSAGNVLDVEALGDGSLTITRLDASDAPLPGGCYEVRRGNDVDSRGCDTDDGSADGNTAIAFPEGLEPDEYTVVEVTPPAGAEAAEDQDVNLQQGSNAVQLRPAGGLIEGPGEETPAGEEQTPAEQQQGPPGNLVVTLVDENNQPIGEACFQLRQGDTVVAEECDSASSPGDTFPGNGNTGFFGVPSGTYTLRQSSAPEGTQPAPDQEVDVPAGDQANITVSAAGGQTPAEAPSPTATEATAAPGDVVALRQDPNGNPVGGACFEILDANGTVVASQVCDEDGDFPDDGRTGFFGIPVGDYVLRETRTPEGYEPAPDTPFTVIAGEAVDVPVGSAAIATETPTAEPSPAEAPSPTAETTPEAVPGNLIVTLLGPDQQPIGNACFQLVQGDTVVAEQCDDTTNPGDTLPGNGNTGFFGVPSGSYTLRQSRAPEGSQPAPEQQVDVPAGDQATVTVTAAASAEDPTPTAETPGEPTPTEAQAIAGDAGDVVIDLADIDQSQGPVCVELNTSGGIGLINAPGACDNGEGDAEGAAGVIRMQDVPPGEYSVVITQGPPDAFALAPQTITVTVGQIATVTIDLFAPTATATAEPSPEPTATPEPGAIEVSLVDPNNQLISAGGACVAVDGGEPVCDGADGDASGEPGVIEIDGVPAGARNVAVTQPPDGFDPTDGTTPVDVAAADIAFVAIQLQPAGPTTGTLTLRVRDSSGQPVGDACFTLANTDGTADVCDEDGDGDITAGNISFLETTVTQASARDGYNVDPTPQTVTLAREQPSAELTFINDLAPGVLPVVATNGNDEPVGGACWTLTGQGGSFGPLCDDGANGGTALDGQVQFEQIPQGTYTLSETQPPTGFLPADSREVTVNPGENQAVRVAHEVAPATVQITTTDGQNALPSACYALDDGEPVCDEENGDGIVLLENVAPGDHTVRQTTPPAGYRAAADQAITVGAGESVQLAFQNAPLTGSIAVAIVDPDGNAIPGGCVTVDGGNQVCDDQAGDANTTDPGVIRIDGVSLGDHQVILESIAAEFELPDQGQTASVEADAVATVTFQLARVQPQTGAADVTVRVEGREVVPGACVVLTSTADSQVLGPFCDGDTADSNGEAGIIGIDTIPVGTYVVSLAEGTQAEGGDVTAADTPSVTIVAGERVPVTVTLPPLPITGTARILTVSGETLVGGACYELYATDAMTPVCDNGDRDEDGTAGVIELGQLRPGTYQLRMSQAPEGYQAAADTEITIEAGETTEIEVQVTPQPQPGTLTIAKVDGDGNALGGACFGLQQNGVDVAALCDEDGDGALVFEGLAAGSYTLVETRTPSSEYEKAASRTVTINAGQNTDVSVTNLQRPGRLLVTTVDAGDSSVRLNNACYRLDGATTYGPFCDADDGMVNGRVVFNGVVPGDYTLVQNVAPAGYQAAADRTVSIAAGTTLQITVENEATPPPPATGTLVVLKRDGARNDLPGGCFQLLEGANPITDPVCDIDDGVNDARIVFADAPVGTWTLRETLAPSASYVLAEDREVTVEQGQTTEVEVINVLQRGRVLVRAVNDLDQPLQNACFDLANDNADPRCTDTAGETLFADLEPGRYQLSQTQAPYGYEHSTATQDVQVQPGQTTVVKVVFVAAPPPDTGSVQIQKFYCPAGDEGERTQFLGGAQGNAQLAKTAGCAQDNAAFTLEAEDGSGNGPGAFQTGSDGRYQVTLPQGIYLLTETDPDLPGASSARLRVATGQLTTVVVINFIAPPEPEPVTINVASYTCPPSFNGTVYDDFAATCRADRNLTNNLTVRAEGPVNARQVTGDQGQLGRTTFTDLPAGKYTIRGEKPFSIPLMYQFCGADGNWPAERKAINGSLTFTLEHGQTLTCQFFQVPEELTQTTGGILVQKFDCPVQQAPKGYDFKNECGRSDAQNQFELNLWNLEMQRFEDFTTGQANPDGILRFTRLQPGTYELKEIGATWCFAQSNSVDARGNLIVKPNSLVEVYIYNCVGTKEPPNTGSGDAAALPGPAEGTSGALLLMNLAWPALGLAAWLIWRSRRPAPQPVTVRSEQRRRRA